MKWVLLATAYCLLAVCLFGCARSQPATHLPASAAVRVAVATSKAGASVQRAKDALHKQEIVVAHEALEAASAEMAAAAMETAGVMQEMGVLVVRVAKAEHDRDFWRAWTWRLALLLLVFGIWIFRKVLVI